MINIIDPHIHLFDLNKGSYQWLRPQQAPHWPDKNKICQNFSEQDLSLSEPFNLVGFVHIEAGFDNQQPWRELQWLEQCCQLPFKSVSCCNLNLPDQTFVQQLSKLQNQSSLTGVRHILDDLALKLLSLPQVERNLKALAQASLSFDCQLSLLDTPAVMKLCDLLSKIPNLVCIINHAGFPPTQSHSNNWFTWKTNLKKLAQYEHVYLKCSGWEMASRDYSLAWAQAVIEQSINTFSDNKVMLASNFPLCLLSKSYYEYWHNLVSIVPENSLTLLAHDNAKNVYRVKN